MLTNYKTYEFQKAKRKIAKNMFISLFLYTTILLLQQQQTLYGFKWIYSLIFAMLHLR